MRMDKITRILLLYRSLIRGDLVTKPSATVEFGISERSFDRDIQDIRLFLSESFSGLELIYDNERRGYHLENLDIKREIATGECYILTKLLLDSRLLRTDDREEIVEIMLSQLSASLKQRVLPVLRHSPRTPICLNKASVKLIEDLLFSIERKDRISLQFGSEYCNNCCVPYSIEFRDRTAFLVAFDLSQQAARLYLLDDILSYVPANYPYILNEVETEALQRLVILISNSDFNACQDAIYKKELII